MGKVIVALGQLLVEMPVAERLQVVSAAAVAAAKETA